MLFVCSIGCERNTEETKYFDQQGVSENLSSGNSGPESTAVNQELDSTEAAIDKSTATNNGSNVDTVADQNENFTSGEGNQEAINLSDGAWSSSEVIIITSILFNLLLLGLLIFLLRKNNRLFDKIDIKDKKLNSKDLRIQELNLNLQKAKNRNGSEFQQDKMKETIRKKEEFQNTRTKSTYTDEKPFEVVLDPKTASPPIKTVEPTPQVILYAGKPSEGKTFTAVSPQQDEHRSIFKLTLENKDAEKALFEVVESNYVLKMAANSPDTYLYHVCKPENSNQNFDGKILTTTKGTARLMNGQWKVNDEDKATINFQ